jgi:hypothetical protein
VKIPGTATVYGYNDLNAHLHWQSLLVKSSVVSQHDYANPACLGFLDRCSTNRIISISVMLPKVAKASRFIITLWIGRRNLSTISMTFLPTNYACVNKALLELHCPRWPRQVQASSATVPDGALLYGSLRLIYIIKDCRQHCWWYCNEIMTSLLTLATLGKLTQIEMILFV